MATTRGQYAQGGWGRTEEDEKTHCSDGSHI